MKVWQILTKSSNLVTDEILNFDEICNFGELQKMNFDKIWKFGIVLQNLIINLDRSRSQLSKNTKIIKFGQISLSPQNPKFLIIITNFVGSRYLCPCHWAILRVGPSAKSWKSGAHDPSCSHRRFFPGRVRRRGLQCRRRRAIFFRVFFSSIEICKGEIWAILWPEVWLLLCVCFE